MKPSLFRTKEGGDSRLAVSMAALLAVGAGALAVLAFPPFGLAPALVVALAVLYGLLVGRRPGEGFLIGWSFGIGLLGFGIFWIRISLNEFGNMGVWLAHALTLVFILAMALYYGLLGGLTAWLTGRLPGRLAAWASPLLVFPALWVLLEWLRGWLLTGFPWLNAGDSQVDGPLAGYVPLLGVYGVSLLVALSAGLLWCLAAARDFGAGLSRAQSPRRVPGPNTDDHGRSSVSPTAERGGYFHANCQVGRSTPQKTKGLAGEFHANSHEAARHTPENESLYRNFHANQGPCPGRARGRWGLAGALALIWLTGLGLARLEWTQAAGEPFRAAVLQANIPQSLKWNEESLYPTLRAYVELTREALDQGAQVIVWPETAIPEFLDRVREPLLEPLAAEAGEAGAQLVIGLPVLDYEHQTYFNGLISLGAEGEDLYQKRHLVPFGEFMPLRFLLGPLARAFEVPMSDFSAGTAERPLLRVGPHFAGASICYEDAFPAEVVQALPEAAYLINVSNDAWFGDSLAPHQHLGIARMRALETGRWLVRATNTGISALIDHRGQVRGTVPAFQRGLFSALVQPRVGATPFAWVGNVLPIGLALAMLGAALLAGWWRRRDA